MPDQKLMMNRPLSVTGEVNYPKPGDPGVVDDKVMRGLGTFFGIDEQQPGDVAGGIGAMAGMLPIGAISKLSKLFRTGSTIAPVRSELSAIGHTLPREFTLGMESEMKPIMHPLPQESDEDKLYRIVRERTARAMAGARDPRIPDPRKGQR